jgi:protocatechuate 3,4-dioxygenase beta subunit
MTLPLFLPSVIGSIPQTAMIEALGWALVHFVWQGAAVALALGAFLAFARRLSPQVRYAAACAALALMALGACSTLAWHIAPAERQSAPEIAVAASIDAPRPTPPADTFVANRPREQHVSPVLDSVAIDSRTGAGKRAGKDHETAGDSISSSIDLSTPDAMPSRGWADRLRSWLPGLVALWGAGVGLLSLRLAHGWETIRRLRSAGADLADPAWLERVARLQQRLGISRSVRLLTSAATTVPMVIGSLKPAILVPASLLTGLSAAQVEALLVHELVHIRRHDYVVNLVQNLLETLFFYHPAVWWVSGQIRKEREHCCDDVASAACGALDYAQALASLAELRQASPGFGLAANGTPLVDRIRRLAGVDPASQRAAGWLAVLALVALITAIALRPADRTHADAQDTKTVKGTVIDANGRPVAEAEVIARSHQLRCGSAQTNSHGEFQMQVPTKIAIDAYSVSVPHWFEVSFTLDQRAPLALSIHRFAAPATVEKQAPLVLKVKSPNPWGGYLPPSKGPKQSQSSASPAARFAGAHAGESVAESQKGLGSSDRTKPNESSPRTTASAKAVRRLAGRVIDHQDKPIAGAQLWWVVIENGYRKPTVLTESRSDAAGRFRLDVPADKKPSRSAQKEELWVLAPGKRFAAVGEGEKLPVMEDSTTPERLKEVVIHLDPSPDFSFQVNDAGGKPVRGATFERLWLGRYFPDALFGEFPKSFEWPAPFYERDRATTDASGVAHLEADSDEMRITSTECGIQTIHDPITTPPVFPIGGKERYVVKRRLINLRPVGRVKGRVFADDSRLVRGRKLRISTFWEADNTLVGKIGPLNLVEGSATVTTDAQGCFIVNAIAEGSLRFKFLDAQANPSLIPIAQPANVRANETTRLEIRLRAPTLADGLVQADATGEPVPGAEIFLGGGFELGTKLTADEHGRFQAPFAFRQVSVPPIRLPDERHADYQQHYCGVRPGKTRQSMMHSPSLYKVFVRGALGPMPLDIPAIVRIPSKMLEGTVVDNNGRPVAGAWVEAKDGLGRYVDTTDAQGAFEFQVPKAAKFESIDVSLSPHRVVTEIKVRQQDPLVLHVSFSDDSPPKKPEPAKDAPIPAPAPKPSESKQPAPGSSKPVRKITGSVIDHEGKPIAKARLWWLVHDDSPNKRFRTVAECATDAGGHFHIEAPFDRDAPRWTLGQLWVLAEGKNWTVDDAPQRIDRLAAKGRELVIRLEPASDIEFQVNDAAGRTVPGTIIENNWGYFNTVRRASCGQEIYPIESEIPPAVRALWRTTADASGRAHLHSLRDVSDIKVTSPEFGTQVFRLPQNERTSKRTIRLRQTGRVEGRVVADDPRSVGGIKLWLRTWMSPESLISAGWSGIEGTDFVTTDAAGRFCVPAIAEGELILRVLDCSASPTLLPRIPQGLWVTAGKTTRAEIRLEPSVPVEGVVQSKERGQPVAGVRISLRSSDSDSSIELTSDAKGRYQSHVLPGSVWMSSMIPDELAARYVLSPFRSLQSPFPLYFFPSAQQVRVKPMSKGQPFQLPATVVIPARSVHGTVIDANGKPLARAAVHGDTCAGRYWASTDAAGAFDLRIPQWVVVDAYDVALPSRVVTEVTIEKRDPLILKVKSLSATGGYEFSRKRRPLEVHWASAPSAAPINKADSARPAKASEQSPTSVAKPTTVASKPQATTSSDSVRKIKGRVVDRDGKPILNARLWWVVLDDFSIQRKFTVAGATDGAGRFQMQAPSDWKPRPPQRRPADTLWILAPGKDLKIADAANGLTDVAKSSDLIVQVDAATETTYQVKDSQGRPVIDALVEPWHFHTLGHRFAFLPDAVREALRATTDKSGRVHLHSLTRQELFDIRVTASGFGIQTLRLDGDDAAAAERTITLRPTSSVRGQVVSNDPKSVRGIKVFVETRVYPEKSVPRKGVVNRLEYSWVRECAGMSTVTTDEAGRFFIPAIAEGQATISVVENPASPALFLRLPEHFELIAAQPLDLEVPMERSVLVRGTVLTQDTRQPVPGTDLRIRHGVLQWEDVASDAQGRYEAHVLPGPVRTQVANMPAPIAAHYAQTRQSTVKTVEVHDGGQPFELPPILLMPTKDTQTGSVKARDRIVQTDVTQPAKESQPPLRQAATAGPSKPPSSTTAAGQSARKIAGRVVDRDGKPIPKARLWWVVLESFLHPRDFTVEGTSDADGRFEMQAPAEWKPQPPLRRTAGLLWILAPGKDAKMVPVEGSTPEGKPTDLIAELDPATETVYQVNDFLGRPVPGAVVDPPQFRITGASNSFPEAVRDQLRTTTDTAGRARLRSVPRSFFSTVHVTAPGFGTQCFRPDGVDGAASARTLTLRPAGRIEGRLDAADQKSVRGAKILFQTESLPPWRTSVDQSVHAKDKGPTVPESDGVAIVTTDATGRFLVPSIAEGPTRISFLDVPAGRALLPRVPSRLVVQAGATINADMRMSRPILVRGSIRTQDTQQPVVGAEISVGFDGFLQSDQVISDVQGRFEAHVLPGNVRMQVINMPPNVAANYTETGESMGRTIEVDESAQPFELPPILLAPTETVEGTLTDHIGRRLANARVCGNGERRRYGFAVTNADGEFALHLPKKISIDSFEAWLPDQANSTTSVKIMRYRPLVLCVDLPPSSSVSSAAK